MDSLKKIGILLRQEINRKELDIFCNIAIVQRFLLAQESFGLIHGKAICAEDNALTRVMRLCEMGREPVKKH